MVYCTYMYKPFILGMARCCKSSVFLIYNRPRSDDGTWELQQVQAQLLQVSIPLPSGGEETPFSKWCGVSVFRFWNLIYLSITTLIVTYSDSTTRTLKARVQCHDLVTLRVTTLQAVGMIDVQDAYTFPFYLVRVSGSRGWERRNEERERLFTQRTKTIHTMRIRISCDSYFI